MVCGGRTDRLTWNLVDAHGWSRIALQSQGASLALLMKVLRQGPQDLAIADAWARARRLLSGELRGTRVERELLAERLRDEGLVANAEALG